MMLMKPGLCNLWMIFVPILLATAIIMKIASAYRDSKILNIEDHEKSHIASFFVNLLFFVLICIFTPMIIGPFFWIGTLFILVAGVMYVLSIIAFMKTEKSLTTNGIYSIIRNPMYTAMVFLLMAFSLMALQSNWLSFLLLSINAVVFIGLIHIRVLNEEKYLAKKHQAVYCNYIYNTPRYIPRFGEIVARKRKRGNS